MSGDWRRSYGANCDTGSGRKPPVNGTASHPTATAPVVDSTRLDRARMGEEDEKLIAGAADLGLEGSGQIAAARRGEDGAELPIQAQALGRQRRSGQIGDVLGEGEDVSQPELQAPGHGIVAGLDAIGDVGGEMREAGLMCSRMTLLGCVAVRDPHCRPMAVHHLPHHDGAARRGGRVHHGLRRMEDPMIGVAALDAHAGLIGCDHCGPA